MPFEMVRNDITRMKVDAIVNAANRSLLGGGGVDGAIHRAAGPKLLEECRTLGGCETGEAKITKGYDLPARYVIHTVGPIWHGGGNGEKELLTACYRHSLELAVKYGCESVAFPMISAGAYGYPKDQAMAVAVETITDFLMDHDLMVWLVVFGPSEFATGKKLFRDVQEYIDDVYAETHSQPNLEAARQKLWHEDEQAALFMDMELGENVPGPAPDKAEKKAAPASPGPASPRRFLRPSARPAGSDLAELLRRTDAGFSETLLQLIDRRGMTDAECYKKANVDRRLFNKIRSNPAYQPSKPTVFAFAAALELSLPETRRLLEKAGFALTRSSGFDLVMEYCIKHRVYDVIQINEILFELDMPLLGSSAS